MSTEALRLDAITLARANRLAKERNVSIEAIVSEAIERLSEARRNDESTRESIIGLFSDAPEMMDQIVAEAYQARARDPLRVQSE